MTDDDEVKLDASLRKNEDGTVTISVTGPAEDVVEAFDDVFLQNFAMQVRAAMVLQ